MHAMAVFAEGVMVGCRIFWDPRVYHGAGEDCMTMMVKLACCGGGGALIGAEIACAVRQ